MSNVGCHSVFFVSGKLKSLFILNPDHLSGLKTLRNLCII